MSLKVKGQKAAATPEVPAPTTPIANVATPQTARAKRLATGGRQSTLIGQMAASAFAAPKPTLTGIGG